MLRRAMYLAPFALVLWACSTEESPAPPPNESGFQSAGSGGSSSTGGTSAASGGKNNTAGTGNSTAGTSSSAGSGNTAGANAAGSENSAGSMNGGAGETGVGGTGVAGSGGVESGFPGCELPSAPGEFYALEAQSLEQLDPIPMCAYRGKVVLVVNVASKCGYTPQYSPLQQLFDKYKAQGFEVLGFPCSQFADQEFADDADISQFCTEKYGITFPMFSKIDVNGPQQHPVYTWLKSQPGGEGDIPWNFTKFLLGRDGKLIKRIATQTEPDAPAVVQLIEEALAAPTP